MTHDWASALTPELRCDLGCHFDLIPAALSRQLSEIDVARGHQEAFAPQHPAALESLKQQALIQSVEASNAIENITAAPRRIEELVAQKAEPRNRPEAEIAGKVQARSAGIYGFCSQEPIVQPTGPMVWDRGNSGNAQRAFGFAQAFARRHIPLVQADFPLRPRCLGVVNALSALPRLIRVHGTPAGPLKAPGRL